MSELLYIPFVGVILSIAIVPLIAPKFWHLHYGKVGLFWLTLSLIGITHAYSIEKTIYDVSHTMLLEYIPFICLVLALYTVSGGLRVHINAAPKPLINTLILVCGSIFASIVGTAGASMILIRPFLKLNQHRKHRVHQVVFFIFTVSNIGGALTPLGDPPLFMGFLKGIHFFWTTWMFWPAYITTLIPLLVVFYLIDNWLCEDEVKQDHSHKIHISVDGKMHFVLLACIVGLVLQSGIWKPGVFFNVLGTDVALQNILRDLGMVIIAGLSLLMTPMLSRRGHEFHWEPFLEVSKLFFAIFITLIPVIQGVKVWGDSVKDSLTPHLYYWLTGGFSAFLDNAPTYLIFFNLAGGDPNELMISKAYILEAISLGAVYMGAMTYIGNAPNFMVASIARNHQVRMPSFFGYMIWSIAILLPILLLIDWVFLM